MPWRTFLWRSLRADAPSDRIFYHNIWFRGHNNVRYAALLPRLERVDPVLAVCSSHRWVRAVQFRLLRWLRAPRERLVLALASRTHRWLFATNVDQVTAFRGGVVVDLDDPLFTAHEVELLNRPNVRAVVFTSDAALARFRALGLTTPAEVVPQGVRFADCDESRVAELRAARDRDAPGVVLAYVAALLVTRGDRGGDNPLYNIDHLLELWADIAARVPTATLWLIGDPSERVRARLADDPRVVLAGRVPPGEVVARLRSADVALYPRRVDHAPFAVKIAEYLGCGLPTVAYRLPVTDIVARADAGSCVDSPAEFVAAVARLAGDAAERRRLGANAARAGAGFDWQLLGPRYATEIIDRFLPRDAPPAV